MEKDVSMKIFVFQEDGMDLEEQVPLKQTLDPSVMIWLSGHRFPQLLPAL
jgi:hypothetical protein